MDTLIFLLSKIRNNIYSSNFLSRTSFSVFNINIFTKRKNQPKKNNSVYNNITGNWYSASNLNINNLITKKTNNLKKIIPSLSAK